MAAHSREIEQASDPDEKRQEFEELYTNISSPMRTAKKFGVLDVIDPRETCGILCDWIEDAWNVIKVDRFGLIA